MKLTLVLVFVSLATSLQSCEIVCMSGDITFKGKTDIFDLNLGCGADIHNSSINLFVGNDVVASVSYSELVDGPAFAVKIPAILNEIITPSVSIIHLQVLLYGPWDQPKFHAIHASKTWNSVIIHIEELVDKSYRADVIQSRGHSILPEGFRPIVDSVYPIKVIGYELFPLGQVIITSDGHIKFAADLYGSPFPYSPFHDVGFYATSIYFVTF